MIRFNLFGIPVQIQPFFWITLALIGGALHASTSEAMLEVALFIIAGFVSILVHELGHALTGKAFGARSAITLQAFGGYAAFSGKAFLPWQNFLVIAAGPALQILLGLLAAAYISIGPPLAGHAGEFLRALVWVSFVWAILNLLPVLPLDGGQLLNTVLGPRRIRVTLWVSIIVACVAAAFLYTQTRSILFPIFMLMFAWQAWQALKEIR